MVAHGRVPAQPRNRKGRQGLRRVAQVRARGQPITRVPEGSRVGQVADDPRKGPALWTKFKEKYGETDKVSNFFTGDHSRPTERIKNINQQIKWHYSR